MKNQISKNVKLSLYNWIFDLGANKKMIPALKRKYSF